MANDKIYLAQKDDLDNHINDRKNPHKLVAADIGAATPAYVDQQIALVTSTGIPKLNVVPLPIEATVDGQTEFFINLETFDALTDTVLVLDGRGMLLPNADFIVEGSTVIVNDPWNLGDIGGLLILKNVPMGDEGSVSGSVIAPGTIPFSALEEEIQGMIKNASGAGTGKLATYFFPFEATVDGQTVFIVPLESFDIENDTIFVVDGQGMLLPGIGYTVAGREITMAEPWSLGDGGGIYVLRNTINPDAEYVSGSIIANGSIPAEKLKDEYLPLDGSKSMFGQLIVERENYPKVHLKKKSTGAIGKYEISDNDELVLMATNQDDTDFARLYLRKNFSDISEILEVGDESNTYKVYGEHNKPTAEDVGARPNTWMPTASDVGAAKAGEHMLRTFYSLSQMNITTPTSEITMQELINKMYGYSILIVPLSTEWNSNEFPTIWGTLEVVKIYGGRIYATLRSTDSKGVWVGAINGETWTGWTQVFMADGSVPMSGELYFNNGLGHLKAINNIVTLTTLNNAKDWKNTRQLIMRNSSDSGMPLFKHSLAIQETVNGVKGSVHHIFGEHNKPSGSYTGNGSATSRMIDTGGFGSVLYIHGHTGTALVGNNGAFVATGDVKWLQGISFSNGYLTIATSDSSINYNGVEYFYQVL